MKNNTTNETQCQGKTAWKSPVLVVDTREPKAGAWAAHFSLPHVHETLQTGDYSALGLENLISIERKTLDDLIGCLTIGRDRFERELLRAGGLRYFGVIVEADWLSLQRGNYRSGMNAKSAAESIAALSVRYRVPFMFAGNRPAAATLCQSLISKFYREQIKVAEIATNATLKYGDKIANLAVCSG